MSSITPGAHVVIQDRSPEWRHWWNRTARVLSLNLERQEVRLLVFPPAARPGQRVRHIDMVPIQVDVPAAAISAPPAPPPPPITPPPPLKPDDT